MSVDTISSQIGLSKSRIYHLLTESQFVNDEIAKVQRDLVESQKYLLVCLYRQILEKLQEEIESGEQDRELRGVDRVIQLWTLANGDGGFRRRFGID
jgi:hypothetical protein